MSDVFLLPIDGAAPEAALEPALERLWSKADLGRAFKPKDLAGIKLHVGEPGTKTFVSPAIAAAFVRLVAATGARPFLTDTSVLYRSPRDNGAGHIRVAHQHGFGLEHTGAPFVPADGLTGSDEVEIEVGGRHFQKVAMASGILQARSLLIVSHVTGHLGTGLGATLKNVGMGCTSKKGKLRQHHGQQPDIAPEQCIACGVCAEWCPSDAIIVEEHARIDGTLCIGCGECVARCQEGAVRFSFAIMGRELQERIVEHAAAVIRSKPGSMAYVNVAQKITRDCDCLGVLQPPLLPDIGILASHDPVAIDQAALDLIRERSGRTLEALSYPQLDGTVQTRYAEELGLGTRSYTLVTVEA